MAKYAINDIVNHKFMIRSIINCIDVEIWPKIFILGQSTINIIILGIFRDTVTFLVKIYNILI